jgi:hypothetical protein
MPQERDMKQAPGAVVLIVVVTWTWRPRFVQPWSNFPKKNILLHIQWSRDWFFYWWQVSWCLFLLFPPRMKTDPFAKTCSFFKYQTMSSRSRWLCGLRCGSVDPRLLGLWVRIPLRTRVFVSCVCCVGRTSKTSKIARCKEVFTGVYV